MNIFSVGHKMHYGVAFEITVLINRPVQHNLINDFFIFTTRYRVVILNLCAAAFLCSTKLCATYRGVNVVTLYRNFFLITVLQLAPHLIFKENLIFRPVQKIRQPFNIVLAYMLYLVSLKSFFYKDNCS
jgi:ABC-type transport system involved in cytochrome c biogenesis permease subunit